jgi:hypothetical protein
VPRPLLPLAVNRLRRAMPSCRRVCSARNATIGTDYPLTTTRVCGGAQDRTALRTMMSILEDTLPVQDAHDLLEQTRAEAAVRCGRWVDAFVALWPHSDTLTATI